MPRTANRVPHHEALGKRSAVVRARRVDREHLVTASSDEHGFALRVACEHRAIRQLVGVDTAREIGA